jgi:O-methyltransferase
MLVFTAGEKTVEYFDIFDPFFAGIIDKVRRHTLTLTSGVEAAWALYQSIEYVVRNDIPGDIVECGVWSGGSMLLAAHALMHFGDTSRRIFLYDTFRGMPKPDDLDLRWDGVPALPTWERFQQNGKKWGFGGTQDHVRNVVYSSGYPQEKFVFVEGMVEATLPATRPEKISLLRLDTDLYSSTDHELVHLYPVLSVGGVLIIDDYGWLLGAQIATDQFIAENRLPLFLTRINESVRLVVKPQDRAAS